MGWSQVRSRGGITPAYTVSGAVAAFLPAAGFALTPQTPGNYADGQIMTLTGPPGSFGTKPNGVAPLFLNRYGNGYLPSGGTVDPLSRTAGWTDAFFPSWNQTGPVGGQPGIQSATACPGSSQAWQTNYPGACVITGTLTNGSGVISNVVQVSGTPYTSVLYSYGGLVAKDFTSISPITSNNLIPDSTVLSVTQSNLGTQKISFQSFVYSGTTTNNVTIYIAAGADQKSSPVPLMSQTQDQLIWWRRMNTFPFRSNNFGYQNNKYIRSFTSGLTNDLWWQNYNNINGINRIFIAGTSSPSAGQGLFPTSYTWTANQWYTQTVMYRGNSSAGSTDAGIIWMADNQVLMGTMGAQPNSGFCFWGSGSNNPTNWDDNDTACRCLFPLQGDATYTDKIYQDDSVCCILIGPQEIQIPVTIWSDTQLKFVMQRSYLDALNGGMPGSLASLSLKVQRSNYTQVNCGTWLAAA